MRLASWIPTDAHAAPLVDLVQRAEAAVLEQLLAELRRDSLASALGILPRIRAALERLLGGRVVSDALTDVGERARAAAERSWSEQVHRAVGRELALDMTPGRELFEAWIADNTARISGLRTETAKRLADDLETAIRSSVRPEDLAAKWQREGVPTRHGTLRGRALVIARDQLGTLAGQIAEQQQRALGITHYTWDAARHVSRTHRPEHLQRHGQRFAWASPPADGHPGRPILCQCRALADVDAVELRRRVTAARL